MEVNISHVVANLLGILHDDDLTIDLLAHLCQFLGNGSSTYRTVELTRSANLGSDAKSHVLEGLGLLLCISLKSGELVSLLTQVLGQHFLGHRRSNNTLSLRNQVVTAIT